MESEKSSKWFADLPPDSSIDLSRRFGQDAGSSKAEIGHRPGVQGSSNAVTRYCGFSHKNRPSTTKTVAGRFFCVLCFLKFLKKYF